MTSVSTTVSPVLASRIELWPLRRLKRYERHPREHGESQIRHIPTSISEFGFTNHILVNGHSVISVGEARYRAAQASNLEQDPMIVLDHLTETQQRAYRIADAYRVTRLLAALCATSSQK